MGDYNKNPWMNERTRVGMTCVTRQVPCSGRRRRDSSKEGKKESNKVANVLASKRRKECCVDG